jgi:ABC-type dipeptide/oligopeptide/nickel transport system ATPase component
MRTLIHLGRRIIIVGLSGSGKTTLAKELSSLLNVPWTRIDSLVLDEHSRHRSWREIEAALLDVGKGDEWIVEGPWRFVPARAWNRATTIILLHYPRALLIWRVLKRARSEAILRRRMTWGSIKHTLLKHPENRRALRDHVDACRQADTNIIRIGTPRASRRWFLLQVRNFLEDEERRSLDAGGR